MGFKNAGHLHGFQQQPLRQPMQYCAHLSRGMRIYFISIEYVVSINRLLHDR
jgi:hypothetical protein